MTELHTELVKGAFTLGAVALGSVVALRVYFRQKEYDLTKQRYLEQGIDVVASELEVALGIVSHNYARSLQLCKFYRDSGPMLDTKELERGFLELDSSKFHVIAHHRLSALLQNQVVWESFQSAMAHATTANSVITQEIPEAIRRHLKDPNRFNDRKKLSEDMVKFLQEKHDQGSKYENLIRELHALSLLLEAEPLSLKAIAKFSSTPEVRLLIGRLRNMFPAQIEAS